MWESVCQEVDQLHAALYTTYMDGQSPHIRRCARTGSAHGVQGVIALLLVSAEEANRLDLPSATGSGHLGPCWLCATCYADVCMNASSRIVSEIVDTIDNVFAGAVTA